MNTSDKICSKCIMDTTVPGIFFDESGECNFCKIHKKMEEYYPLNENSQEKLKSIVEKIKSKGKDKEYDCVLGVSGGADSTYALYIAKKMGLNPLAVHMDNGWDSELSVSNIEGVLKKLDVDLKTVVLDWEEFKDLQISFLKASVPDIENPTDRVISAVLYKTAIKENIEYIINGQCFRTGGKCPIGWNYGDAKYTKYIHKKFGNRKMKKFSNMKITKRLYYMIFKKIKTIPILNYVDYNVEEVKKLLRDELGWRDYETKHCESVYTKFIQSYILPKKFNIDKRKIHYSALIRDCQISRKEAIKKIKTPAYDEDKMEDDKNYVIKKLGLNKDEFEDMMETPPKIFLDYPNNFKLKRFLVKLGMKLGKLPEKHKYYTWDTVKKVDSK